VALVEDGRALRALRILYVVVVALVAAGGLFTIVDWAMRGDELPGGGVPVTGRVVEEQPGFAGASAIVEVTYEAGGRERRARLPVAGGDPDPRVPSFEPGDPIALLVSRNDPERVQQVGWGADTVDGPAIPAWLMVGIAVFVIAPLVLRGPRQRLQAALARALNNGGGRGI
jgi:hypothetical protein